jgi:hypothetical protein
MRALKWLALAAAGVGVAFGLEALNNDPGDPRYAFLHSYIWVLAAAWVALMISAIFVERRR